MRGFTPPNKISVGGLAAHMYFFRRKWAAETVISTRLRKSEKRKMRKRRAKEIKRGQKEKRIRKKERRGKHKKRISVRKICAAGSEGGGRLLSVCSAWLCGSWVVTGLSVNGWMIQLRGSQVLT